MISVWNDDSFDDLDDLGLDELEGEWTDLEIEFDEDEDEEKPRGKGVLLKILLAVLVLCIAAAVTLLLLRYVGGNSSRTDNSAGEVAAVETVEDDMAPAEEATEEAVVEVTPEPTPTPTPEPTPTPVPAEYQIPGVNAGDLDAVHAYIQTQLDAIAADIYCPHWDSVTANEDCTVFTVIVNGVQESAAEQEAVAKIFEYGKMYAAHAGTAAGNLRIDYVNRLGTVLWSKDLETGVNG